MHAGRAAAGRPDPAAFAPESPFDRARDPRARSTAMIEIAASHLLAASLALSAAGLDDRVAPESLVCLATNVYHEARSESLTGQAAVAHVTLNRVRSAAYPDTVCAVVTQKTGRSCQFGWHCDGRPDAPQNERQYRRAVGVALDALAGKSADPTAGATYFVSSHGKAPSWTRRLTETVRIEGHRFFRR